MFIPEAKPLYIYVCDAKIGARPFLHLIDLNLSNGCISNMIEH